MSTLVTSVPPLPLSGDTKIKYQSFIPFSAQWLVSQSSEQLFSLVSRLEFSFHSFTTPSSDSVTGHGISSPLASETWPPSTTLATLLSQHLSSSQESFKSYRKRFSRRSNWVKVDFKGSPASEFFSNLWFLVKILVQILKQKKPSAFSTITVAPHKHPKFNQFNLFRESSVQDFYL